MYPAGKEKEVKGHSIKIDKSVKDWIGIPPVKENTWIISKGEYIFRDAKKDDLGAGLCEYPTNEAFGRCADLREFRVTCDVYDLASRSSKLQIEELKSYKKHSPKGDPDAFAIIEKSYLTVRFAK